ncbi:MAG: IgGFc-binding protein, partial [Nannocystaceae bacterium]
AALLLPAHAWGENYLAAMAANDGTTWLTVVSLEPDNNVEVFVPEWGTGTLAGGGIPAIPSGGNHAVTLQPQQTLRIAASDFGEGITGTAVYSDKPIAVFVGSPGMSLPGPGFQAWKDSLEEQITPRSAWGTEYAAIKFQPRSSEHDLYRIVADKDGTVVELSGDFEGSYPLDEGEVVQFSTDKSFYATGNEAFLLAHMMVSASENAGPKNDELFPGWFEASNNCGEGPGNNNTSTDMGDPAITFLTPVDQFRNRYTFLTPYTYAWDMITVVAPQTGWNSIALDGEPLPEPTLLAGTDLVYTRILVADGSHHIESPSTPFGLEVYGYDCRISYAYPGGLSLGSINIPPPPPG